MKHLKEKDLSLDEQVVSRLNGLEKTNADTENCIYETLDENCTKSEDFNCKTNEDACNLTINSNTCRCTIDCHDSNLCNLTNSAFEICCDKTVKECPTTVPVVVSQVDCPVEDTLYEGCITPIPETEHC